VRKAPWETSGALSNRPRYSLARRTLIEFNRAKGRRRPDVACKDRRRFAECRHAGGAAGARGRGYLTSVGQDWMGEPPRAVAIRKASTRLARQPVMPRRRPGSLRHPTARRPQVRIPAATESEVSRRSWQTATLAARLIRRRKVIPPVGDIRPGESADRERPDMQGRSRSPRAPPAEGLIRHQPAPCACGLDTARQRRSTPPSRAATSPCPA